jgi:hypothetical protein
LVFRTYGTYCTIQLCGCVSFWFWWEIQSFTLHPSLSPYRQRNKYTHFAWAGETFFPVVLLCCVSFWFWQETRELALHYFPADCFGIKREIVFGVMYVLSVQYSCAVVSVFLLWRESLFCSNTLQSRLFLKNIENFLCKNNNPI